VSTNTLLRHHTHAAWTKDPAHLRFPGSALARFLELRGRRVVRACGAVWYAVPGRFLMSLPYQAMLNPDLGELRRLMRETHTVGARFPSLNWTGLESGLYVLRRRPYDIDSVHAKHRPRVRKGMEKFHVRPATISDLMTQGRALNLNTMARQQRFDPEFGDKRKWETLVEAAFACSEVSFPAAFAGSRMASYMITVQEEGWLHILHQMSRQEDLPNFPNHVLTFSVTQQAANDESLSAICYGCVPLFEADGLHEYKLRFGYDLEPHHSAIQFHPAIGLLLDNPFARLAMHWGRKLLPQNQLLETIDTVMKGARSSRPPEKKC
jgi:hypothetical protein